MDMGRIRILIPVAAALLLAGCVSYPDYGGYGSHGGHAGQGRHPVSGGRHDRNDGYSGQGHGTLVRCESIDGRNRHCSADTRGGVSLSRQLSRASCIQGSSWGWDNSGIWVSGGCRAEFVTGRGGHGITGRPGAAAAQVVRCESDKNRYRHCGVQVRRDVQLSRQLSKTQCVRGRNWDWDRNGIWVDQGCRAEFSVR